MIEKELWVYSNPHDKTRGKGIPERVRNLRSLLALRTRGTIQKYFNLPRHRKAAFRLATVQGEMFLSGFKPLKKLYSAQISGSLKEKTLRVVVHFNNAPSGRWHWDGEEWNEEKKADKECP